MQRAQGLIASYQVAIGVYIQRLANYYDLIGRLSERLGDPEPKELS